MSIMNAIYYANYEDYEGYDEVPCIVDTDTMEVLSFGTATASRWYDGSVAMCIDESVRLSDGRSFAAIKYDEYNDAICEGFADEYNRNEIVLFDADQLEDAMSEFKESALEKTMSGFEFNTCQPTGVPGLELTAKEASYDVADAAEHIKRAIRSMEGNIDRNRENNIRWPGFYDGYLAQCDPILEHLKKLESEMVRLSEDLSRMG
jgi:hypothetical protein